MSKATEIADREAGTSPTAPQKEINHFFTTFTKHSYEQANIAY